MKYATDREYADPEKAALAKGQDFHLMRHPTTAWAELWHLWTVIVPRRSITGRLLWGRVWRRHNGRHWIYKKFVE